jgi:hypothetical protein
MKKKFVTAILAISCLGVSVGSVFGQSCNGVSVVEVGTSTASASNLIVALKNESGVDCGGGFLNGATQIYALTQTNTDQMYAGLLTAMSLQKKMFVNTLGAGGYLDVLIDISVKN